MRRRRRIVLVCLGALCLGGICAAAGCFGDGEGEPRAPGPLFEDVTARSGIRFELATGRSEARYLVETMIGGLGWIDHDGDGDLDLYVVNGHSDSRRAAGPGAETNRLYRNDGDGRFTDVTEASGTGDRRYGCGVAVGDYDGDGRSDLLVTNFGRCTLFHNEGGGRFADVTERAGITGLGFHSSAAWFDFDRDGDLDLYVVRYLRYDPRTARRCIENGLAFYCHPRLFPGAPDLLYRNRGDGTFEEIGRRAGIARAGPTEGKGLGVVTFDHDHDGDLDVYVANDLTPNFLWRNNGDGTFTDVGQETGTALGANGLAQAGMGVDVADLDGNGWSDIHVTNFSSELNALYLGDGTGFIESAARSHLGATYSVLGFGTLLLDADLDGDEDILTVNGHVNDRIEQTDPGRGLSYAESPDLFLNDGRASFRRASAEDAGAFFAIPAVGRGAARCDLDGDGDVDLAVMTSDRGVRLLLSRAADLGGRSVTIRLAGTRSPRDPYGAWLEVHAGGRRRVLEYQSARSYLSASDPAVVIGLGAAARVDRLAIHWPSGVVQEVGPIAAGERRRIVEPEP